MQSKDIAKMSKWRRIGASTAGVLLAAGTLLVGAQPVSADDWVPPSGNGILRAAKNKCVEVIPTTGNIMYAGNRIQLRTCDGAPQQQWFFDIIGYTCNNCAIYHIVNRLTGMCLDNMNGASNNRNPLQQWTCNGSDSMVWVLDDIGPIFQVLNKQSGKCMDATDGLLDDGTRIQQYTCFDYPNNVAQNYRIK